MKNLLIFLLIALLLISPASAQHVQAIEKPIDGITLLSSSADGVELVAQTSFDDLTVQKVIVDGVSFTEVALAGWSLSNVPGEPRLPFGTGMIGVPFGTELSLEIIPGPSRVIQLQAPMLPGTTQLVKQDQNLELLSDPFQTKFEFLTQPDDQIYDTDMPYPRALAEVVSDGVLRDQRIAAIAFYPIQYAPKSHTLHIYESLLVRVEFSGHNLESVSKQDTLANPFNNLLTDSLLNFESAKNWRVPSGQVSIANQPVKDNSIATTSFTSWQPQTPAWRIETEGSGMFALNYSDLEGAGILLGNPSPIFFSLFYKGVEVAIEVVGEEDESFDLDDLILFYAPELQRKYTKFNIFWLTINNVPGKRLEVRPSVSTGSENVFSYTEHSRSEQNINYLSKLNGDNEYERFVSNLVIRAIGKTSGSSTQNFELDSVSQGPADLTLNLIAYTYSSTVNPDHHIKFYLNEHPVGDSQGYYWDGGFFYTNLTITLNITDALQNGNNILKLELPNDLGLENETVLFDWFAVNYTRATRVTDNHLEFSYEETGDWRFNIEGFTHGDPTDLRVWDVSDTISPKAITGFELSPNEDGYTLTFGDEIQTTNRYLTIDVASAQNVSAIESDFPSDLTNPQTPPEMIIISHADFLSEAERLAAYRRSVGVQALAVDVQDIYDEFAYGVVDPRAIKDFLGFALDTWNTQYVLLLGDGHYDPKNYLGFGRANFIPAFLAFTDPWIGETAADNRYVTLIGDDLLPDMMIGRLTVNTLSEAERVVNKIIAYEQNTAPEAWKTQLLSVADNADGGGNFAQIADDLFANLKPENYNLNKVHYQVTHTDPAAARTAILDLMNAGQVLVNYIGHGSYTIWADEPLFSRDQVPFLTNTDRLSINLSMTCTDGFFHDPSNDITHYEGLAETVTRSTDAGAIASWSPTGQGIVTGHDYLNRGFYEAFFNLGASRVGEATLAGKLKLWATGTNQDLLDTYTLFGDPALRFPRITNAISDQYETLEDTSLVIPKPGVIANDINGLGLSLTAELAISPSHGQVNLAPDGSFVYVPDSNYFGTDSFSYTLFDGSSHSNSATVTISVRAVNDPPIALDQEVLTFINNPVTITLEATDDGGSGPYFLLRETEAGGVISAEGVDFSIVTQPLHGDLTGTPANITYTPFTDYLGTDQFTFKANDGELDSNTALVKIYILETIISPLARDDTYEMFVNSNLLISSPGVLGNDTSQNEQPLSAVKVTDPLHGSVSLTPDGGFSYQAESGFAGTVSFVYKALAGSLQSNQAEVKIIVKPHPKIFLPIIFR